jgi:hypothetical protein
MADVIIELGGRSFIIPPFTLRRVKVFVPMMAKLQSVKAGEMTEANIDDAADAVLVGIQAAHPSFTKENLLDMPVTLEELFSAVTAIGPQAGLKKVERPPAEAAGMVSISPPSKANGTSASPIS